MTPSIKLGLLALASSAIAVPHYGHSNAHSKFHTTTSSLPKPYGATGSAVAGTGKPYPTGGWGGGGYNGTYGYGSGTGTGTGVSPESTSTTTQSIYATETLVSTIYMTRPKSGGGNTDTAVVEHASTGPAGDVCGPATITVTASEKVTVTVTPGGGANVPSSAASSVADTTSEGASYGIQTSLPHKAVTSTESAPEASTTPSPTSEAEKPISEAQKPTSEAAKPTSEAPKPTFEQPKPTSEKPKPTSEKPQPTSEAAKPTTEAPKITTSQKAATSTAASTPKPSGGAGGYHGGKRGLAYNDITLLSNFNSGKYGWAMNWADGPGDWNKLNGVSFIPMMHNPLPSSGQNPNVQTWLKNVETAVGKGCKAVMGFNEVDQEGQAKMPVADACKYWQQYMNPVKEAHPELTIIGPSVTNGPAPMGLDYLDHFAKECPQAKVDVTHIHFYDIYNEAGPNIQKGTVDRFVDHVKSAISKYGKPVFVSEFGLNPGSATEQQAAKFLKGCLEFLDNEPQVLGYAYFMVKDVPNGLIKGNSLSTVGQVY